MSTRLKVGFVSLLSCLAIMLGLFASTDIASAHTAQATQSQVSASTSVSDSAHQCFRRFEENCFGFERGFGFRRHFFRRPFFFFPRRFHRRFFFRRRFFRPRFFFFPRRFHRHIFFHRRFFRHPFFFFHRRFRHHF